MTLDMTLYYSEYHKYREEDLARLILILVTPDPPTGLSSTSTGSTYHVISGTIAKDALLLVLEGIVQSSDAFPPLKSAASGLLFFATCADVGLQSFARGTLTQRSSYLSLDGIRQQEADPRSPQTRRGPRGFSHTRY